MIALAWVLSVLGYTGPGLYVLKRVAWWFARHNGDTRSLGELNEDWIPVTLCALLWPVFLSYCLLWRVAVILGVRRWVLAEPVPRAARRERRKVSRLGKLNEAIKAAEQELATVNAMIQELQKEVP